MHNAANAVLKQELKDCGLLYEDIARETNYSLSSIKKFFAKPMDANMERFIRKAVEDILDKRNG